jgi:hypothetical protein
MTAGSGTRGRRPSSQSMFCCKTRVSATAVPYFSYSVLASLIA